jgi:acetyl/propionyl-CoA carboxylase alpha subunit
MVTGIDLVREQLRVAAGEPLGFAQADMVSQGHAIECRIYAESPTRGFTPTTGRALLIRHAERPDTRLDSGITQGATITTAFDPMLAKLIAHGKDREEARQRALAALKEFVLLGCETNISFLRRLIAHEAFRDGDVHTGFIDAHPELAAAPIPPETLQRMLAIGALAVRPIRDAADTTPQPHQQMGGWRN